MGQNDHSNTQQQHEECEKCPTRVDASFANKSNAVVSRCLMTGQGERERDEEKSVLHYYIPILEKAAERKLNQRHFLSTANVKKRQADDDNDILFKHFRWS